MPEVSFNGDPKLDMDGCAGCAYNGDPKFALMANAGTGLVTLPEAGLTLQPI